LQSKNVKTPDNPHSMYSQNTYFCRAVSEPLDLLQDFTYPKVFRRDFTQPGFAVLDFGRHYSAEKLRGTIVALKNALQTRCFEETGHSLHYQWLGTFDQQKTTKFHRDNAPAQSFLMLGYEPTKVKSLALSCRAKWSWERSAAPSQSGDKTMQPRHLAPKDTPAVAPPADAQCKQHHRFPTTISSSPSPKRPTSKCFHTC
jgi:hypothetical protein